VAAAAAILPQAARTVVVDEADVAEEVDEELEGDEY
jgi:hypothetical protein